MGTGTNGGTSWLVVVIRERWYQADISFYSASDRCFSDNFGLKTRISIFFDWMCHIFNLQLISLKSCFWQASFFEADLKLWGRPYSLIEAHSASFLEALLILWGRPHSVRQTSFIEAACEASFILWGHTHSVRPALFCEASLILWGQPHSIRPASLCEANLILWGQYHSVRQASFF